FPVASITRSKPPASARSSAIGISAVETYRAPEAAPELRPQLAGRLERCGPDVDALESQEERGEHPHRARADHERALELPRMPPADRAGVADRAGADRRRFSEDADAPE